MRYIKSALGYLVFGLLIIGLVITYLQIGAIREEAHSLQADIQEVQTERAALLERARATAKQSEKVAELSLNMINLQSRIEDMRFKPLDIELSPELQSYTYYQSMAAGFEPEIVFAIMSQESEFQVDAVNYNPNGSVDIGICQINSCNWSRLADEGINVSDPKGNIQAAIYILSEYRERYPLDKALAAYNAGERGMQDGRGEWYANEILESSNDYKY